MRKIFGVLVIMLLIIGAGLVSAHSGDDDLEHHGMMGSMMNGSWSMWGGGMFGMGFFGWMFMTLVIVALVLLIVWLIKQLQNGGRKRR